jgi:hypothetical protein
MQDYCKNTCYHSPWCKNTGYIVTAARGALAVAEDEFQGVGPEEGVAVMRLVR